MTDSLLLTVAETSPKRVQMRRGVKLPEGAKYVGRPTRWGNPYRIGELTPGGRVLDRQAAVECYAWAAAERQAIDPGWLLALDGFDLACYCPLDGQPCHADVLLEMLA